MRFFVSSFIVFAIFVSSLEFLSWALKNRIEHYYDRPHRIQVWDDFLRDKQFVHMFPLLSSFRALHPNLNIPPKFDHALLIEPDVQVNPNEIFIFQDLRASLKTNFVIRGGHSGKIKASMKLETDEFGYRVTPQSKTLPKKGNLAMLGCSYTFGWGVDQEETFSATLAKELPERNLYNMGFPGSSPSNLLQRIYKRRDKFFSNLNNSLPTDFVFTFIDDHMRRITGNSEFLERIQYAFSSEMFFYLDNKSKLAYKPAFQDAPYFSRYFFRFYGGTNVAKTTRFELPVITDYHLELTAAIFAELKSQIKLHVKSFREFYVVFYPGDNSFAKDMIPFLKSRGVKYIDYSEVDFRELLVWKHNLIVDYHPSPLAHELYGKMLAFDLK